MFRAVTKLSAVTSGAIVTFGGRGPRFELRGRRDQLVVTTGTGSMVNFAEVLRRTQRVTKQLRCRGPSRGRPSEVRPSRLVSQFRPSAKPPDHIGSGG